MVSKGQLDSMISAFNDQIESLRVELAKAQAERDTALSDVSSVRSAEKRGYVNKEGEVVSEVSAEVPNDTGGG